MIHFEECTVSSRARLAKKIKPQFIGKLRDSWDRDIHVQYKTETYKTKAIIFIYMSTLLGTFTFNVQFVYSTRVNFL